jgi:predicted phage baseplate assembly protein
MPIPLPNLDDRRWADLVEDGRANITRYAPQWTDHNLHDPGITLIDLFAWLSEMTNYRANRVPSRHKHKFLELLGFEIQQPLPAHTVLSFAPPSGSMPFLVPAGSEFEGTDPDQNRIPFRTLRAVTVQATTLQAVQIDDGSGTLIDRTADFNDRFPITLGAALYLGFDGVTPGIPLALGLNFSGPGNDAAERRRIIWESAEQAASCQPVQSRIKCTPPPKPAALTLPPHHSVTTVWEVFTTTGWVAVVTNDDTRSLTLDGIVELTLPSTITKMGSLFYVRCRVTGGQYDATPLLMDATVNAVRSEQAVLATESFVIKAGISITGPAPAAGDLVQLTFSATAAGVIQTLSFGTGAGPQVRVLSYTAPGATAGQLTLDMQVCGIGGGLPNQSVALQQPQADAASLKVYTLTGSIWQQWTARHDFDASRRTDFDFVFDAAASTISFGTGERGQTPGSGCLILARYRTTFADTGNVGPGTITRVRISPPLSAGTTITNRSAASGGAALEDLDHALGRAVELLHAHERLLDLATSAKSTTLDQIDGATVRALTPPSRGINLLDLERLALAVPGTRVARSHAWASLHPDFPCLTAPGVVTVVIVPEYPLTEPVPSDGLITCVWRYLNRRRLVATTLQVTGPEYLKITITASVVTRAGASPTNVQTRIKNALASFLDPLTGGPNSLGWPFGRSVYRSEILQLIQDIPGVDHVATLSMQSDSGGPQCGDIALCPTALTTSGAHQIEVL